GRPYRIRGEEGAGFGAAHGGHPYHGNHESRHQRDGLRYSGCGGLMKNRMWTASDLPWRSYASQLYAPWLRREFLSLQTTLHGVQAAPHIEQAKVSRVDNGGPPHAPLVRLEKWQGFLCTL